MVNKLRPLEIAERKLTKLAPMNVWNKYKKLLRRRSVRRALQEGRPYYGAPDGKHAHVVVSGQPRGGTVRHSGIVPVSVRHTIVLRLAVHVQMFVQIMDFVYWI